MVDVDLGWHLLLTTTGTESRRTIRIEPTVDLPDEIHPIYGNSDMALARATAAINEAAHYRDDVAVSCQRGLGTGLGGVPGVPVDGSAVVGQVESITWTGTPNGADEQAVIRRHTAIAPEAFAELPLPSVADDAGETDAATSISGNVLTNDAAGLNVVAVNGFAANIGVAIAGNNGGLFTVNADGSWTFDPDGEFGLLVAEETAQTAVTYSASNGGAEASATLTVTVRRTNVAPVAVNDEAITTAGTACSGNVFDNDTDADFDDLHVSRVNGSAGNVGVAVAGSGGGLFTVNADGSWTFDPNSEFEDLEAAETAATSVAYYVADWHDESAAPATVTVTVSAVGGIQYIAASTGTGGISNYSVNLPAEAQAGDFIVVITGFASGTDGAPGVVSPSGYIEIADLWGNDSLDANLSVSYKFLGDTPETSIIVAGHNYLVTRGAGTIILLFRNVNATTPLDVTTATAVGTNSAHANPPALTPVTDGAMVVVAAGWVAMAPSNTPTFPAGFENEAAVINGSTVSFVGAACTRAWEGGAVDPAAFVATSSDGTCSWCAVTLALRPA
jgi:VCBS repeat-containing protein